MTESECRRILEIAKSQIEGFRSYLATARHLYNNTLRDLYVRQMPDVVCLVEQIIRETHHGVISIDRTVDYAIGTDAPGKVKFTIACRNTEDRSFHTRLMREVAEEDRERFYFVYHILE